MVVQGAVLLKKTCVDNDIEDIRGESMVVQGTVLLKKEKGSTYG